MRLIDLFNLYRLASIPFKLCDSFGCSEISYLNLNVQDVNDPPIPTNPNVEGHYKQYETINVFFLSLLTNHSFMAQMKRVILLLASFFITLPITALFSFMM